MTDISKATVRPWKAWQAPDGTWTLRSSWTGDDGRRYTAFVATFLAGAQDNEANAALADRAVNTFDVMKEALDEAQFLLDRLDEHEPDHESAVRDFHGHIEPSMSRLRGHLSRLASGEEQ